MRNCLKKLATIIYALAALAGVAGKPGTCEASSPVTQEREFAPFYLEHSNSFVYGNNGDNKSLQSECERRSGHHSHR